jgi:CHASE2 domain-containing sensor protein
VNKTVAVAAVIGLTATAVAAVVAVSAKSAVTAFEWSVYDRPLSARPPKSPKPIVVVRDPASEIRFGAGVWDRAVLADVVSALSRSVPPSSASTLRWDSRARPAAAARRATRS